MKNIIKRVGKTLGNEVKEAVKDTKDNLKTTYGLDGKPYHFTKEEIKLVRKLVGAEVENIKLFANTEDGRLQVSDWWVDAVCGLAKKFGVKYDKEN